MRFTTKEIAEAVDGHLVGPDTEVTDVTIDSRSVTPGNLFVPIVAERDGHDFIEKALAGGAAAYLTAGSAPGGTAIEVADTAQGLTALGAHARSRLGDRVVGVTGSVGKTSLKDLLRAVGSTTWSTWANRGSFNNELGVPLTLTNAPDGTELTVVEMGARGVGHIADLCAIARPTIGIVTVVAGAHLEQFGSLDGVARAKSELVASLPTSGTAVLNADDRRVAAMASVTDAKVVTFGVFAGDVRAESVEVDDQLRARFLLRSPWGDAPVRVGVAGRHQVTNALGAAAAALALGATPEAVAEGLAGASLSDHRMSVSITPDGVRLIDDSYNANPTSMLAALDALAELPVTRRLAVVGTMAELGEDGAAAHREIRDAAFERDIELIVVAEPSYEVDAGQMVDSADAAVARIQALGLGPDCAVLVKASRSAGLERVIDGLSADQREE